MADNALVAMFRANEKQCREEAAEETDPQRKAQLEAAADQWLVEIRLNNEIAQ